MQRHNVFIHLFIYPFIQTTLYIKSYDALNCMRTYDHTVVNQVLPSCTSYYSERDKHETAQTC